MGRAISRIELSKKKRRTFLDILAKTGQVTEAAQAVGYTSTTYLHRLRAEDEDFAEQWDLALKAAGDFLKAEAWRRAHDGVLEPDYYKGEIVGYTTKYSDQLLMFLIKQVDPSYRDTGRGGDMSINFGVAVMPMQAPDEGAWEQRAIEMHGDQTLIQLEEKPKENLMIQARAKVTRSD